MSVGVSLYVWYGCACLLFWLYPCMVVGMCVYVFMCMMCVCVYVCICVSGYVFVYVYVCVVPVLSGLDKCTLFCVYVCYARARL